MVALFKNYETALLTLLKPVFFEKRALVSRQLQYCSFQMNQRKIFLKVKLISHH